MKYILFFLSFSAFAECVTIKENGTMITQCETMITVINTYTRVVLVCVKGDKIECRKEILDDK